MELQHYISIIWRRKWIVILTVIVTMGVVIFGTFLQTPIYQASTTLRIAVSTQGGQSYSDYQFADRLMNTYIEITTSEPVLSELMKRLNLTKPPTVKAEILPDTELIVITVEDADPEFTATSANTLADILITQSSQLYTGGGISSTEVLAKQLTTAKKSLDNTQQKYQQLLIQTPAAPEEIAVVQQSMDLQQNTYANLLSQYEQAAIRETMQANMITIVEPANIPQSPAKPNKLMNYALGLFVGLFGGVGLAFLFENLDTTLHNPEEIQTITKMISIAGIPKANKKQLDISRNGTSHFAETFRNLATKIHFINHQASKQVLVVISAEPRQGKSMIVSNLAYALAEAGEKVIAIDCDMRLPKLHRLFHLPNQFGLSDILLGKAGLRKSLQKLQFKGISVLTSGSPADHPAILFSSSRMTKLIESLCKRYTYVLLDTPAFLPFADTDVLAHYASGLILVVRQNYTKRESVQLISRYLSEFREKTIALVVNQVNDNKDYGYYGYSRKRNTRFVGVDRSMKNNENNGTIDLFKLARKIDQGEKSNGINPGI